MSSVFWHWDWHGPPGWTCFPRPVPGRAVPAGRTRALRDGSRAKLLGAVVQVLWCGSGWGRGLETPRMGTSPLPSTLGTSLVPQNSTTNCPAQPAGGPVAKAAFSFKTTRGGSGAKARAVRSPGDLSLRKYFLQQGPTAAAGTMGDSQREQS